MNPSTITDPVLGELTSDESFLPSYWGEISWRAGKELTLCLGGPEHYVDDSFVRQARGVVEIVRQREAEFTDLAARRLVDSYNQLYSERPALDRRAFAQRIQLGILVVELDGSSELRYDDGDPAGCCVILGLKPDFTLAHAYLDGSAGAEGPVEQSFRDLFRAAGIELPKRPRKGRKRHLGPQPGVPNSLRSIP